MSSAHTMKMTNSFILLVVVCLCACKTETEAPPPPPAPPGPAQADETPPPQGTAISVDWDDTHQTIVGFGGTMGWVHPHPKQREEVFDLLFTTLGASVLRIRALGGEGGDEKSLEPANDNDDPNTFNWAGFPIRTTEAKNAIIIKAARERGVKTVIPVTWSPPGWMKSYGSRAGGGSLKPDLIDEHAELWAAYVIGMKREFDIDIGLISIQNEPDLTYYYPTCWWEPDLYAKAVATVAARLKRENLPVQVLGPDTCRMYNMPEYVEAMEKANASPGTPILTHLYDLSIPYERVDRDPARWREARDFARKHKRPLWFMETANYLSYGIEPASYEEAIVWAQKIHWALTEGDCEVVCFWALFFDKRGEALIYCKESEHDEYEITPKFYTSMNYYRFVRPGMVRCSARCENKNILVTAFKGKGRERVIVAVNPTSDEQQVDLGLDMRNWQRHETTAAIKCAPAQRREQQPTLPPQSVTTFVREAEQRRPDKSLWKGVWGRTFLQTCPPHSYGRREGFPQRKGRLRRRLDERKRSSRWTR